LKANRKNTIHPESTDSNLPLSPLPTYTDDTTNNHKFHSPAAAADAAAAMTATSQRGRRKLFALLRRHSSWPQNRDDKSASSRKVVAYFKMRMNVTSMTSMRTIAAIIDIFHFPDATAVPVRSLSFLRMMFSLFKKHRL